MFFAIVLVRSKDQWTPTHRGQANPGRVGTARLWRRIACQTDPLEHDSVHQIRIALSRTFCVNSALSCPTCALLQPQGMTTRLFRSSPSFGSKVCNKGHHQRSTTDRDYLPAQCHVSLPQGPSVCQPLARVQPFLVFGTKNLWSSNLLACPRLLGGWHE